LFRLLFIGDIYGRVGRTTARQKIAELKGRESIDFVIGNGENVAGGNGITPKLYEELIESGIDVVTSGNHIFDRKEIIPLLKRNSHSLLRPVNLKDTNAPGNGVIEITTNLGHKVAVLNICGSVRFDFTTNPFHLIDGLLSRLRPSTKIIIIDFHAETTSEKNAFAYFVDGKVSAVLGTHTHIQTSDERILPGGTAFITDVGMTGPFDSVIGCEIPTSIRKFLAPPEEKKIHCKAAEASPIFNAVIVEIDPTGRAQRIQRISDRWEALGITNKI
jgi:metallophosphoesterase (TIGR00282 family)